MRFTFHPCSWIRGLAREMGRCKIWIMICSHLNPLGANPTKRSSAFKQLCLTILWGWRLKGQSKPLKKIQRNELSGYRETKSNVPLKEVPLLTFYNRSQNF